jgi:hypothetical protein
MSIPLITAHAMAALAEDDKTHPWHILVEDTGELLHTVPTGSLDHVKCCRCSRRESQNASEVSLYTNHSDFLSVEPGVDRRSLLDPTSPITPPLMRSSVSHESYFCIFPWCLAKRVKLLSLINFHNSAGLCIVSEGRDCLI